MGVAGAVAWVWYRDQPLALRASVLVTGAFLATPYAWEYDLALLGLAFAWLGWQEYQLGLDQWAGFADVRLDGLVLLIHIKLSFAIRSPSFSWRCSFSSSIGGLRGFLAEGNRTCSH